MEDRGGPRQSSSSARYPFISLSGLGLVGEVGCYDVRIEIILGIALVINLEAVYSAPRRYSQRAYQS
jgi:hypothetical protein